MHHLGRAKSRASSRLPFGSRWGQKRCERWLRKGRSGAVALATYACGRKLFQLVGGGLAGLLSLVPCEDAPRPQVLRAALDHLIGRPPPNYGRLQPAWALRSRGKVVLAASGRRRRRSTRWMREVARLPLQLSGEHLAEGTRRLGIEILRNIMPRASDSFGGGTVDVRLQRAAPAMPCRLRAHRRPPAWASSPGAALRTGGAPSVAAMIRASSSVSGR